MEDGIGNYVSGNFLYIRAVRFLLIISVLLFQFPVFANRAPAPANQFVPQKHMIRSMAEKWETDALHNRPAPAKLQSASRIDPSLHINERLLASGILNQSVFDTCGYNDSAHHALGLNSSHIPLSRLLLFPKHYFW